MAIDLPVFQVSGPQVAVFVFGRQDAEDLGRVDGEVREDPQGTHELRLLLQLQSPVESRECGSFSFLRCHTSVEYSPVP